MGSIQEDAFYPPHDLCVEIQDFLAENEHLFSKKTWSETAVVYSIESNFYGGARPDQIANNTENLRTNETLPFWSVCEALSSVAQPYDVVFFPEGTLSEDTLSVDDLQQYRTIVLPGCHFLTSAQGELLERYLEQGGTIISGDDLGMNLPDNVRRRVLDHPNTRLSESPEALISAAASAEPQVSLADGQDLAINIQRVEQGAAIHIIRYGYCEEDDRVPTLDSLDLVVRLAEQFDHVTCIDPCGQASASLSRDGDMHKLSLRNASLYSIVLLGHGKPAGQT
jgi:hypothetical protein